jgi:phospholipid/cholesterol/gamma-HCH transport system ATP-binding protein
MKLIEVNNVFKAYEDLKVLEGVSLSVNSGESLAVVGPSGVGKSTLLKLICGLETPDSGDVKVFTEKVGMVFQSAALLNSYTVYENIALALHNTKLTNKEKREKIEDKLSIVGLEKYIDYMPDQLSGGQRKRVGFARAIANDPEVILYDEPTAGLDPILCTLIEDYITNLAKKFKVASIVITHQLTTISRTSEHVLLLYAGKVVYEGKPSDFMVSKNPYAYQFVNSKVEGPIHIGLVE